MLKFIECMHPVRAQLEKFRTLACVPVLPLVASLGAKCLPCSRYMVQRRERIKAAYSIANFQVLNQRQAQVMYFAARVKGFFGSDL
jgi:hypothetical protein